MSPTPRLIRTYRGLPRASQWAVLAGIAVIGYFAVIEPAVELLGRWNLKAKETTADLKAFSREAQTGERALGGVAIGLSYFGEVAPPGDSESRVEVFNRRIAEVLERHGIRESKTSGRKTSMAKGPLLNSLGTGAAVTREFSDLEFEATPEQVTAIVADLERVPEVAGVSRVQLRRVDAEGGSRLLRANVSVETWVIQRKGTRS